MKKFLIILATVVATFSLLVSCGKKGQGDAEFDMNAAPVLSNDIFEVKVPSRFDGQYLTKVKENVIDFYDKECVKAGYNGWLFGICAYEEPDEWAGGPVEKVGELKTKDGKKFDVIISYPTETQYGVDKEMPEKYKSFYDARYEIAENVYGLNGEKVGIGSGAKGENLYNEELDKHIKALKENWDSSKLESENMSTMYALMADGDGDIFDKVGYAYKDLNVDGIDELIIGEVSDDTDSEMYDVYTMVNGKAEHVLSGWDRNRYYSYESGLIVNEYSDGADSSGVAVYALTSNSTELFPQLSFKYDGYTDEKNPWFIAYDKNGDDWNYQPADEKQFDEFQDRFSKHEKIDFKALSSIQ